MEPLGGYHMDNNNNNGTLSNTVLSLHIIIKSYVIYRIGCSTGSPTTKLANIILRICLHFKFTHNRNTTKIMIVMFMTKCLSLQITTKYIDGRLKGGFKTVKAYAEFCGYFKNWLDAKSIKLWPSRQGEMVAQDYRHCLKYVNREVMFPYDKHIIGKHCKHKRISLSFSS